MKRDKKNDIFVVGYDEAHHEECKRSRLCERFQFLGEIVSFKNEIDAYLWAGMTKIAFLTRNTMLLLNYNITQKQKLIQCPVRVLK